MLGALRLPLFGGPRNMPPPQMPARPAAPEPAAAPARIETSPSPVASPQTSAALLDLAAKIVEPKPETTPNAQTEPAPRPADEAAAKPAGETARTSEPDEAKAPSPAASAGQGAQRAMAFVAAFSVEPSADAGSLASAREVALAAQREAKFEAMFSSISETDAASPLIASDRPETETARRAYAEV